MYVAPLTEIDSVPSLGAMIGNVHSQDILTQINARWGTNTVAFGLANDPYKDEYQNFMNLLNTEIQKSDDYVLNTTQRIFNPDIYMPITNEHDLACIPQCMQIPMLMMPVMRDMFEQGMIWGWGWNPESLPEEDVYGRLIDNGRITIVPGHPEETPDYITWEYRTTDPDLTEDQLDAIDKSRRWLAEMIYQELSENGQHRDPTDLSNLIGKPKK